MIIKGLTEIVGEKYVAAQEFVRLTYTNDFSVSPPKVPVAVVKPGSTEEIIKIMQFANEHKIPVSPRGGGSAQEGGCLAVDGGIVLETLRLNKILKIDEENGYVTVEAGVTFGRLMAELEKRGWKIGIAPSGALAGTVGAHLSRPGVGWGNIRYVTQGDQVLSVRAVLPDGTIVDTGTRSNPGAEPFFRYALGPDLTGLFIGAEGIYGIVTEATLRIYPNPEKVYIERFKVAELDTALKIFRDIAVQDLVTFISAPLIKEKDLFFDVNIQGFSGEVDGRAEKVRSIINSYPGVESLGSEAPQSFWPNRWYHTGEEFLEGIAGVVNFFLPHSELGAGLRTMRQLIEKHGIKNYVQQLFPGPTGAEVVALLFHYPKDQEEYQKIHRAIEEMMPKALQLGGAPYSKGRQWAPYLEEQMRETGYWSLGKAIKKLVDPNNIMNPGVIGF
jgi:FAD/FMN-containing dehydrogenase